MQEQYKYFVFYHFNNNGINGTGNISIIVNKKVKDWEDISTLTNTIKRNTKFSDVVIANYILMEIIEK